MKLTREDLIKTMSVASENFNRRTSPELFEIFFRRLNVYEREVVKNAFERALEELKYFPCLAEILAFIEGDPKKTAEIKWAGVLEILRKHGKMELQRMTVDGATAFAVERMGGVAVLYRDDEQLPFLAPRFKALYDYAAGRGLEDQAGEIYGAKKRVEDGRDEEGLTTYRWLPHKSIEAPPTLQPPARYQAIGGPERTRIAHTIQAEIKRLAAGKSL